MSLAAFFSLHFISAHQNMFQANIPKPLCGFASTEKAFVMCSTDRVQTTVMLSDETNIHGAEEEGGVGWGADGRLMWVHTERLTWPASSLSAGGFPAAPGRCGRGRCCGPPAPACWAGSEASQPAAPSSSCGGGSLLVLSTSEDQRRHTALFNLTNQSR